MTGATRFMSHLKTKHCRNGANFSARYISFVGETADEVRSSTYRGLLSVIATLGIVALIGLCFELLLSPLSPWWSMIPTPGPWPAGVMTALCIVYMVALKRIAFTTETMINLGLIYHIAFCFLASYAELVSPAPPGLLQDGVSFVCVLIVLFPMFVPTTLGKTTCFSFLGAMTGPITALVYSWLSDWSLPENQWWLLRYAPNFLAVWMVLRTAKMSLVLENRMNRVRRLGSYELKERLGVGGMGEVWLASHRMLRRPAAIKLINPEALTSGTLSNDQALATRFEREAQATAELHSPHTIHLYDFGQTSENTFYYVMELLDGLNLKEIVQQYGPLCPERVVHILRQVCDSLHDAHQSGLIHRDIKPANIYLCRYGHEVDFVKVLDFGLVKESSGISKEDTGLTAAGILTGTPAFISPETATGTIIDARSDIYALGCVGYWLLTGHLVFDRETPLQMVLAHVQDSPDLPSRSSELSIPPELERVIMACLAKKPAERPQSAAELAEMLSVCSGDKDWNKCKAQDWWNIHRPAE
jgi:eukaryotic-like serine/threonine-protein kinase